MDNIIHQILNKMGKKIIEDAFYHFYDIDKIAECAQECCKQAAIEIVEAFVDALNLQMREEKTLRKERGLVLKEKERKRELLTTLGPLNLARDYYFDQTTGKYVTPLDGLLGLQQYHRIGDSIKSKLVTAATDTSYAKSSALVCEGAVSRQSVRNYILEMNTKEIGIPKEKKCVKELHIFADEDHVHLQKPHKKKGKASCMVPLVVVTEGIEQVSASRRKTINPKAFVDEALNAKELWKTVEAYILGTYDAAQIETIYIHGDGGRWIKNGLDHFPNRVFVLDEFHVEKYIKRLSNAFPRQNVAKRIRGKIKNNDKAGMDELLQGLYALTPEEDRKTQKKIKEVGTYLLGNWDAIVFRKTLNLPGSCTEGQVSHLLSERFSRNPMGWSKDTLGKLSMDRIFLLNEGEITAADFKETEPELKLKEYLDLWDREAMEENFDWSIFEPTEMPMDPASGTQIRIQGMGKMRMQYIS